MAGPAVGVESPGKGATVPDWIDGCDLNVCKVLQELSAQIVTNCRSFGAELEGVCDQAKQKLPTSEPGKSHSNDNFDCADACFTFLENFGQFSGALLQLAGDLEAAVARPLENTIATMMEESVGRLKHWQQVRNRFAELQDRYCRSRQKSLEARKMMSGERRWSWQRSSEGKAATEQHAAMRELAQCEEELLQSEASLRELEDQSRERIRQLENEKKQLLRGALTQGAGLLKRLLPGGDKAPPPTSDEWHGVLPAITTSSEEEDAEASGWLQQVDDPQHDESPVVDVGAGASVDTASCPATPGPALDGAHDEAKAAADDPASKYLQSGNSGVALEFCELREVSHSDDSDVEAAEALSRAIGWSPQARPTPSGPRKKRGLVFQSNGPSLIAESSVHGKARQDPFYLQSSPPKPVEVSTPSAATTRTAGTPSTATNSACSKGSGKSASSTSLAVESEEQQWVTHKLSLPGSRRNSLDEDEDSDASEDQTARKVIALLDSAEVPLELAPLVAEHPQRCFERYVQRLGGRSAGATETTWSRLQAKASEQILGGHVGKLEVFWLHRPGVQASPETAEGLVCFQFVQGAACNYGRILHLSVADGGVDSNAWKALLPSAIFEVRRLMFGMLPIDSIRAVVLAGQDGDGPIYVDSDVEVAYQRCRFRWFQLTQNIKRTKGGLVKREKVKLQSRFLVLHAMRSPADPRAPHSDIGRLPALLLKNESQEVLVEEPGHSPEPVSSGFTNW